MNMRSKVRALQSTLSRAAKQSLDRRFGALYDKIYREDVLWVAWERVRANAGAPGVDRQSFDEIEKEIGVEAFLKEIAEKLRAQRYRPLPVRRCWIDKPGKPEKRPLGIPVIRDRVIQMATKIVIEPIFEANFLPCSYGFRPKRNAHMAIRRVRSAITFKRQTTVIDADIKGYFDNIRHDILDELIQRRISDPRVLKLIRGWLRAGVLDDGEWIEPNGLGTPQGGVISPLLANIYLHSFDKMFEMSRIPGTLVRYADDLVVLVNGNGKQTLERIRRMLGRLGLVLHAKKTRTVRAEEGFDFLGVHFRLCRVRKRSAKLKQSCRLWPSDRSIQRIRQKVKEVIGRRFGETLEEVIARLTPVLRGWSNYHTAVQPETKRLLRLNYYVRERLRIFLKRKYSDQSRGQWRVLDNLFARLGLYQFGRALYFVGNGC
jgi:group II intron reverse transcriptase/maturase